MNQVHRVFVRRILPLSFLLFIGWVIYLADAGRKDTFPLNLAVLVHTDKLAHFVLYGLITAALGSLVNFQSWKLRGRHFDLGAVLSALFACVEELSQLISPHRTPDLFDLVCGLLGIAAARVLLSRHRPSSECPPFEDGSSSHLTQPISGPPNRFSEGRKKGT